MNSFADIRLVVADLDGTLLDDEKQLDAGIVDVIRELEKRNIMFTLAQCSYYEAVSQGAIPAASLYRKQWGAYVSGKYLYI